VQYRGNRAVLVADQRQDIAHRDPPFLFVLFI
jgi:hypothetical protein